MRAQGYDVRLVPADDNRYSTPDDTAVPSNASLTVCRGAVIQATAEVDPNVAYPRQLEALMKDFGQPRVKVQTAVLRGGTTTYVEFSWRVQGQVIKLDDYPPSPAWPGPPQRKVLLSLLDRHQTCFWLPPEVAE